MADSAGLCERAKAPLRKQLHGSDSEVTGLPWGLAPRSPLGRQALIVALAGEGPGPLESGQNASFL